MNLVRDLMVTAAECEHIHQDMTVREAMTALGRSHDASRSSGESLNYGVNLVLNDDNQVVGKLSSVDIVMNMDPNYPYHQRAEPIAHTAAAGLSSALLKSLMQDSPSYGHESFENICQKMLDLRVRDCMSTSRSNGCVLESATLEEAIHKLALGSLQTLLVTSGENIVGVLRLCDVFQQLIHGHANPNPQRTQPDKRGN